MEVCNDYNYIDVVKNNVTEKIKKTECDEED